LNDAVDDEKTYTWVAGPDSARAAARSFSRGTLRRRRARVVLTVLWLLAGLFMWTSLEEDLEPLARILWALAYSSVLVICAFTIGTLVGRHLTRRRFATRLGPGTELTSHFGPTTVELTGPLSRHELSYAGLTQVDRIDGWVHLRQLGSPVALVWPGELFPDHELDRMQRAAVAARGR
jgi:hypothetical protein